MVREDAGTLERPGPDGRFIDAEWLNGDPCWVLYRVSEREWIVTAKPQSIFNLALGDKIAVAGEEPHLYGYRFVDRDCMFHSREEAENECRRRNSGA